MFQQWILNAVAGSTTCDKLTLEAEHQASNHHPAWLLFGLEGELHHSMHLDLQFSELQLTL